MAHFKIDEVVEVIDDTLILRDTDEVYLPTYSLQDFNVNGCRFSVSNNILINEESYCICNNSTHCIIIHQDGLESRDILKIGKTISIEEVLKIGKYATKRRDN